MKIKTTINHLAKYKKYLKLARAAQDFFTKNHYLQLDLPLLSPALIPESYLEIFATQFRYLDTRERLYLTPSPELFIKRLIAAGIGDCYFLGKAFRNQEQSSNLHSLEFTILEFYKVGADYNFIKKEVQRLCLFAAQKVLGKSKIKYQKYWLDFKKRWEEISVARAFQKFAGINKAILFDEQKFIKKAREKGYQTKKAAYVDLFSQIYTQEIEPHLGTCGRPTIIYDYPLSMAALAKLNKDKKTCQRFEFYLAGIELGDCYTELTNWQEQERRFRQESQLRKKLKKINHPSDQGFIDSLKKGLPSCSGIAIGFDRLAMIFTNSTNINELQLISLE